MKIEIKEVASYLWEIHVDGEYVCGAASKEEAEEIAQDYSDGKRQGRDGNVS